MESKVTMPTNPTNKAESEVKDVSSVDVGKVVQSFVNQKKSPKKKVVCQKQDNGDWTIIAT